MSEQLGMLLALPDKVKMMMAMGGMIIGLLLLIPEICFWIKGCMCQKAPKIDE